MMAIAWLTSTTPLPATLNVPHPQLHTVAMPNSAATCFAASVYSFVNSKQELGGCRPSRPPAPGPDWKPSTKPILATGIPIAV